MKSYLIAIKALNELYEEMARQRPNTFDHEDVFFFRGILKGIQMSMFKIKQLENQTPAL